jgi:hypothetical protein
MKSLSRGIICNWAARSMRLRLMKVITSRNFIGAEIVGSITIFRIKAWPVPRFSG